MKEKLQTKFATRQYMISDTFELYYYSTVDVPGVKEHTHTHYEFYLFLEGAISLEIDGVLYTPTPGDLLLIPPGVPHHLVMHDLSVPYRRFVFWVSAAFAEQLRARSADYVYLMEYAAENQKYLFPLNSIEFNTIQYRTIRQYISKKRLARCREAMLGDVPVTKVYLLFGFHDYSSFYRAFKKEYGISPKDFKELHTVTSD